LALVSLHEYLKERLPVAPILYGKFLITIMMELEISVTLQEGKEIRPSQFLTVRRLAWGTAGLIWFLWIGYEDRGLTPVLILSAVIAFSIGLEVSRRRRIGENQSQAVGIIRGMAIGGLSGALVGPISLLLASVKTSLHQHESSDFRTDDLIMLVGGIPIWALAGLLFGTAASLLGWPRQNES
jgi:hypothetical protein